MALLINTTFKGLSVEMAYIRIVGYHSSRDSRVSVANYGVWRNAAAAEIVHPDRTELTVAVANLAALQATDIQTIDDIDSHNNALRFHAMNVDRLQRAYDEGTKPNEPALEIISEQFPYSEDFNVAIGYVKMKALPKFADAIDA